MLKDWRAEMVTHNVLNKSYLLAAAERLQRTSSFVLALCPHLSSQKASVTRTFMFFLIISFIIVMTLVRDSPGPLWHYLGPCRTLHALLLVETTLTMGSEFL